MTRSRSFLLLAALAVAALAGTACSVADPAALTVNGSSLSRSDLMSQLNALSSNPTAFQLIFERPVSATVGEAPGTYSTPFTAAVLQYHLQVAVMEQVAAREGLQLTDAELQDAHAFIAQQVPEDLGGFEWVLARSAALNDVLTSGNMTQERFSQLLDDLLADLSVTVDGQFGRWEPDTVQIVPPEGPLPPPMSPGALDELLSLIPDGS